VTGALLCLAGAALLASVKWGLAGHGIVCVTIVVTALMAARWVSRQPNQVPV
jgi:hypothetical protein